MRKIFIPFLALMIASGAVAPALAQQLNVSGIWEADSGESRYKLELCGQDGTQLCADLIWIRPDVTNDRNSKYIGTKVVDHAQLVKTDPLTWRGKISVYGHSITGNVTLVNPERFVVKGCALLIICVEEGAHKISD